MREIRITWKTLNYCKKKCMVSGFDERMTTHMIDLAKTCTSRFGPTNLRPESLSNTERLTRATSYLRSLRLSRKEKEFVSVGKNLADKIPTNDNNSFLKYLNQKVASSMFLQPPRHSDVSNIIHSLRLRKIFRARQY